MEDIVFGIDIGTTKICALVGAVRNRELQIIGLGVQPSSGMRKGMIVDVPSAAVALARAVEAADFGSSVTTMFFSASPSSKPIGST